MPRSFQPSTTPANLSNSVHQQLNMYTTAASASGVEAFNKNLFGCGALISAVGMGMLVTALPSQAKIVYTRADGIFTYNTSVRLDLNHDGITDFNLQWAGFHSSRGFESLLIAKKVAKANAVWGNSYAAALPAGVRIGDGKFSVSKSLMGGVSSFSGRGLHYFGPWAGGGRGIKNRYLGFKFLIRGKVHYGWARITTTFPAVEGTLTGYAYDTVPNKPIITGDIVGEKRGAADIDNQGERPNPTSLAAPIPEVATLGLLAVGSTGLSIWRRPAGPKSQLK